MDSVVNAMMQCLMVIVTVAAVSVRLVTSQNVIIANDTSDIPRLLHTTNSHHIGSYALLNVEEKCVMTQCPASTQDTINMYEYCYERQCSSYDQYHCLNTSGKTVNFCAKFKNCDLRSVDKAVINKQEPGIIRIYNIPCKFGHFQPNDHHSCFTDCAKDTSICIRERRNDEHIPLVYCCLPTEVGCNRFGKMFFELGTIDDDCTGSNQCSTNEDLLPDCSCDRRCPPNYVRLPETNFSCSPSVGHVQPPTSKPEEAVEPTKTESDAKRGNDYVDEVPGSSTEQQPHTEEVGADSNSYIVVVIVSVVSGVGVATGAYVIVCRVKKKYKRYYERVSRSGSDADPADIKSETTINNNTFNAENITVVKGTGNQINVNRTGTSIQSETEREKDDTESVPPVSEPRMEFIKDNNADSHHENDQIRQDASLTICKQVHGEL